MHLVAAPIIILLLFILIVLYVVRSVVRSRRSRILTWVLTALGGIAIASWVIMMMIGLSRSSSVAFYKASIAFTISYVIMIPMALVAITDLLSRVPCLFERRQWSGLQIVGLGLGLIGFVLLVAGCFTRKTYRVNSVEIVDAALPESFDEMKIVQISDMHLESFGRDTTFIASVVDRINSLEPDLIVFTGDIVSRRADELEPFTSTLSRLKAKRGVYSILGNHDYADYVELTAVERENDRAELRHLYNRTAFKLLRDSTIYLTTGGDTIALIGTENISVRHYNTYGSLRGAYEDLSDGRYKILLTHDPGIWVDSVAQNPDVNVNLTLSGHTHAMQMRLLGWTPASMSFSTPAGLYEGDNGKRLYVNVGLGTVGPMVRVGATPEITLITLIRGEEEGE